MSKYIIPIPNEKEKTYRIVTFIILSMNFIGFGYIFILAQANVSGAIAIIALLINSIPWVYFLLNKKHVRSPVIELTGIITAFAWIYFGNYFLGILQMLFAVIGYIANKKKEVIFSEEDIAYPSFPVKKYSWEETEQVIWKDGILTIDLKNNKLLQLNIENDFAEKFDSKAFNVWCEEKKDHLA